MFYLAQSGRPEGRPDRDLRRFYLQYFAYEPLQTSLFLMNPDV